ncbi:MAG: T9SS type A sorting domain-containing protein [Bacteroidetes bacterium]|nr:T9SS type A sorting domain-containing protein [Bacteroidota bacterium]
MKKFANFIVLLIVTVATRGQQSYPITFNHDGLTVNGTFTIPNGTGQFPTVIINAGSGASDRDGTIPMLGANVACLYPDLLNDTLRPYKELSDALVDSGYAVLRYDKLEYTYPTTLGTITFHKLWLPVESAINYVKTRDDVDTSNIILIGHSEGSSLIPFIAKGRTDVKALISIAGARTPFDSILAYQLVNIAQTCGGNVSQAQSQANQILSYFNIIRTNTWNGSTSPLFGVPASVWYDYFLATDSVAINYNLDNLPTLFTGMGLDINVPPAELIRFQNEVTITNDFWSIPGLVHYMTPNNDPHVSPVLTDTIIYWLRQHVLTTGITPINSPDRYFHITPNPFNTDFSISIEKENVTNLSVSLINIFGQIMFSETDENMQGKFTSTYLTGALPSGIYFLNISADGHSMTRRIVKQ